MPPERRPYPLFNPCDSVSTSSQPYSIPSPISTIANSESSASTSRSNQLTTTSFVWDHGERWDDHWQRNYCGKRYKCGHGTSTARHHLKDAHGVEEEHPIPIRCNLTITHLRSRLKAETVEAIECLHWWLKDELLTLKETKFNTDTMKDLSVDVEDLYETGVADEESNNM